MQRTKVVIFAAIILSGASFNTHAAQFGLGAGIISEGGTIFLPIDKGRLRIEPEISFWSDKSESTYSATASYNSSSKNSFISIGAGIYLLIPMGNNLQSYVGSGLGYLQHEYKLNYPNSPSNNLKLKSDGFFVAPAFGTEYFFSNRFSIGLDISLQYRELTGKNSSDINSPSEDSNALNTRTRAMLRYHFQ